MCYRIQYNQIGIENNDLIDQLRQADTMVVTTAHQPCLFTGPLYFIYKIASTIALAKMLNKLKLSSKILPMYVVGSEDHDFDEINHLHLYKKKIEWNSNQSGAVGRMKLDHINDIIFQVQSILGEEAFSEDLITLLYESYTSSRTLAQATMYFVHRLFQGHQLMVIDLDDSRLKEFGCFDIYKRN